MAVEAEDADAVDLDLRADCSACVGLCCVEPAFVASADFALSKPARTPCPHLQLDARCGIHDVLPERGFRGCATSDCFGAGQRLVAELGADGPREVMFDAFPHLRGLQELRWHLREAHRLAPSAELASRVEQLLDEADRAVAVPAAELAVVDIGPLRARVGVLLDEVSATVREPLREGPDRRRADLSGADLRRARLRGVSLRGSVLIGADLHGADLTGTDLLGTDLRGADLGGAVLSEALFLTQPQVDGAIGDAATTLPLRLRRPERWSAPGQSLSGQSVAGAGRRNRSASIRAKRRSGSSRSSPNNSRS